MVVSSLGGLSAAEVLVELVPPTVLDRASFNFDTVQVNGSRSGFITVLNPTNAPMSFLPLQLPEDSPFQLELPDVDSLWVSPHSQASFGPVVFRPPSLGSFKDHLIIRDSWTRVSVLKLQGTGGAGEAQFLASTTDGRGEARHTVGTTAAGRSVGLTSLSALPVNFSRHLSVSEGNESRAFVTSAPFFVRNSGNLPLTVSNFSIVGPSGCSVDLVCSTAEERETPSHGFFIRGCEILPMVLQPRESSSFRLLLDPLSLTEHCDVNQPLDLAVSSSAGRYSLPITVIGRSGGWFGAELLAYFSTTGFILLFWFYAATSLLLYQRSPTKPPEEKTKVAIVRRVPKLEIEEEEQAADSPAEEQDDGEGEPGEATKKKKRKKRIKKSSGNDKADPKDSGNEWSTPPVSRKTSVDESKPSPQVANATGLDQREPPVPHSPTSAKKDHKDKAVLSNRFSQSRYATDSQNTSSRASPESASSDKGPGSHVSVSSPHPELRPEEMPSAAAFAAAAASAAASAASAWSLGESDSEGEAADVPEVLRRPDAVEVKMDFDRPLSLPMGSSPRVGVTLDEDSIKPDGVGRARTVPLVRHHADPTPRRSWDDPSHSSDVSPAQQLTVTIPPPGFPPRPMGIAGLKTADDTAAATPVFMRRMMGGMLPLRMESSDGHLVAEPQSNKPALERTDSLIFPTFDGPHLGTSVFKFSQPPAGAAAPLSTPSDPLSFNFSYNDVPQVTYQSPVFVLVILNFLSHSVILIGLTRGGAGLLQPIQPATLCHLCHWVRAPFSFLTSGVFF
jgi:hypothetical protein